MEPLNEQLNEVITVTVPTVAATTQVVAWACWVYGYSLRETTGAASADVDVIAGGDGNGDILATVTLSAGQSVRDVLAAGGVYTDDGVTVKVNAGSVRGSVWLAKR